VSKYAVDKLLREMIMHPQQAERFVEDPIVYTDGRGLTDEARRAFVEQDYRTLYGMGAHPFLLWAWTQRIKKAPDVRALIQEYRASVAPLGYPDFGT
jgi:hypothetical protein